MRLSISVWIEMVDARKDCQKVGSLQGVRGACYKIIAEDNSIEQIIRSKSMSTKIKEVE